MTQTQYLSDEQINELRQMYSVTSGGRGIKEWTQVRDFANAAIAAYVAKGALVPAKLQDDLQKASALADRSGKIDRERVLGRAVLPFIDQLLAPLSEVKAEPSEVGALPPLPDHMYTEGGPNFTRYYSASQMRAYARDAIAARQASPQQGAAQSEVNIEAIEGSSIRADAVNLAYNTRAAQGHITPKGVQLLAEAVLQMDKALAASAPTVGGVPIAAMHKGGGLVKIKDGMPRVGDPDWTHLVPLADPTFSNPTAAHSWQPLSDDEKDAVYMAWQVQRDEASYGDLMDATLTAFMEKNMQGPEAVMRQALEALQESWRTDKGDAAILTLQSALAATPSSPAVKEASSAGAVAQFRALLRAEVDAVIDPHKDIAQQEAFIDEADHLLAKFNELFPE